MQNIVALSVTINICEKQLREEKYQGMSFLEPTHKPNIIKISSLRTYIKNILKRMSPGIFSKGSITVEASLAIPIFLFAMINLISIMNIFLVFTQIESSLHQTARELAIYGNLWKEEESSLKASILSKVYVYSKLCKSLEKDDFLDLSIQGGRKNISVLKCEFMKDDEIDLVAECKVIPISSFIGFKPIPLSVHCKVRSFTGYDPNQSGTSKSYEEIVYITPTGESYHRNRSCKHLKLTIQMVTKEVLENQRSLDGHIYYPCEACGSKASYCYYITDYGSRYHSSMHCPKLKRSIMAVPISQVGGRLPCLSCEGD